jgi:predicted dehydrogenase
VGGRLSSCPGTSVASNPGFYYLTGETDVDTGPYYITDLVNLLGPVASVSGRDAHATNTSTSKPLQGRAFLSRSQRTTGRCSSSGTVVSMTMSSTSRGTGIADRALYGEKGSLIVPDPNCRGQGRGSHRFRNWREIPVERLRQRQLSILGLRIWRTRSGPPAPRERELLSARSKSCRPSEIL